MAAKSFAMALAGVRPALVSPTARSTLLKSTISSRRFVHPSRPLSAPAVSTTGASNTVSQTMAQSTSPSGQTEDDSRHAAYLGEADSNDGHEAFKDTHGDPPPELDGTNAAYLGEADSDDHFEAGKEIHGHKVEAVDASQSAYLGEADSDDNFEADVEVNPEKYRHRIEDASGSGLHGQTGEGDH